MNYRNKQVTVGKSDGVKKKKKKKPEKMYSLTQNDDSHRGCTTALTEDVFVNY